MQRFEVQTSLSTVVSRAFPRLLQIRGAGKGSMRGVIKRRWAPASGACAVFFLFFFFPFVSFFFLLLFLFIFLFIFFCSHYPMQVIGALALFVRGVLYLRPFPGTRLVEKGLVEKEGVRLNCFELAHAPSVSVSYFVVVNHSRPRVTSWSKTSFCFLSVPFWPA